MRLKRLELHAFERPQALHMQMVANFNRDPKKGKPLSIEQFYLYQPQELKNLPKAKYGSSALALIDQGQFPYWALFCYKELVQGASGSPPELLCYQSETAILLAPEVSEYGMCGLLIATEEASEQLQTMTSPCGRQLTTVIPKIHTKIIAKENVTLPVIGLVDNVLKPSSSTSVHVVHNSTSLEPVPDPDLGL